MHFSAQCLKRCARKILLWTFDHRVLLSVALQQHETVSLETILASCFPGVLGKLKSLICSFIFTFYHIDTSVVLENTALIKFIRNHIRDSGGVFSISSKVKISMISLISRLSLISYLNSLVFDRNIFGSFSKVFGHLWYSSEIGNHRKFWEIYNVRVIFDNYFLENRRKTIKNAVISMSI